MSDQQHQRSGSDSTNVQIASVTIEGSSVTTADVIAISDDISRRNIEKYSAESQRIVDERITELSAKIAETLDERGRLESAADPGMQYSILSAQRDYARSGDEQMAENLVNLLADRSLETDRNRRQLAIDEAIQVVGRLSIGQMNLLSIVLLMRMPRSSFVVSNLDTFYARIEGELLPISRLLLSTNDEVDLDLKHAAYTGCLSISAMSCSMSSAFWQLYAGCFVPGFSVDDVPDSLRPHSTDSTIFIHAMREPAKLQINAMNDAAAKSIAAQRGIDATELSGLLERFRMSEEEIKSEFKSRGADWGRMADRWDDTLMTNSELTPVGMAIAQAEFVKVFEASGCLGG